MNYVIFGLIGLSYIGIFCILCMGGWACDSYDGRISDLNSKISKIKYDGSRKSIEGMKNLIEEQDALIAILWQNTIGLRDDRYTPEGNEDRSFVKFGKTPPWSFNTTWYEDIEKRYPHLARYKSYPWGSDADDLYQRDFRLRG